MHKNLNNLQGSIKITTYQFYIVQLQTVENGLSGVCDGVDAL